MNPESAKIEARAKIIWGEPRKNVAAFLMAHGFGEKDNRVTGPAYLLGQLFLAGPFSFIKALSYLK